MLSYNCPGVQIRSSLNVSTSEFADLYSCYSWPNVVLPVLGGLLIDSVFGLRLGTVLFSALICAGQLLLGLGARKVTYLHHLAQLRISISIYAINNK